MIKNDLIKVYGYMRSGNHFLMAALYLNFYENDGIDYSLVTEGKDFFVDQYGNVMKDIIKIDWHRLWGGHLKVNQIKLTGKEIYIFRKGKDVLYSYWKLINPGTDFNLWVNKEKIFEWYVHLKEWFKENVYIISYEELNLFFNDTMKEIQKVFDLKLLRENFLKPGKVGWKPGRGDIGESLQYWNEKNQKIFKDLTEIK